MDVDGRRHVDMSTNINCRPDRKAQDGRYQPEKSAEEKCSGQHILQLVMKIAVYINHSSFLNGCRSV